MDKKAIQTLDNEILKQFRCNKLKQRLFVNWRNKNSELLLIKTHAISLVTNRELKPKTYLIDEEREMKVKEMLYQDKKY